VTAYKKDLYVEQGATFVLVFQWCHESAVTPGQPGDPRDLTGWTARMQMRKSVTDPAVLTATSADAKIVLGYVEGGSPDPTNGRIKIELPAEDTGALALKSLKYDMEVVSPSGRVYRLLEGGVTVSLNITRDDP
jgi:hypothetical protein